MSNFDQLEAWVYALNPDVIGVTETWAWSQVLDSEISLEGYDMFRQDRVVDRAGGGVLLYVKSSLNAVKFTPKTTYPEQVWCQLLDSQQSRFFIGVCYRTPTVNIYGTGNHDLLRDLINEIGGTNKHFMLMGDFNYRLTHWPPLSDNQRITTEAAEFYHCLEDNFLTQHVDFCTRQDAILDLIISDEQNMVKDLTDMGPFPGSDHHALSWTLDVRTKQDTVSRHSFDYTKADIPAIKRELNKIDWCTLLTSLSAEDSWNTFKAIMEDMEHRFIPVKKLSTRRKKPIWMTNRALKAVRRRHQMYRKYKDPKHPAYVKSAKTARRLLNEAKQQFEVKLAKNIKEDRKSFFAYARSKTKSKVNTGSLANSNNELVNEPRMKAEMLNDFFSSVFTLENDTGMPLLDTFSGEKLVDLEVDAEIIKDKLRNLKVDKAAGDDNMVPSILKAVNEEIALPVATIFRKSLDTGSVPRDWRSANVTPLFKKGNRHQVSNYRPVSLTSQICKIVESVIRDEVVRHLDKYQLLRNSQHGFRKGYSCTTNLLVFLESVTGDIDAKHNVDTIYLDFAKAFDKVPHKRLISKLKAHGIDGLVCDWIEAWLADRWQRV